MKNQIIKTFLAGLDKRDERFLTSEIKAQQHDAGDRVIRAGTRDRAMFFIMAGSFMVLDERGT
jgi:hypothetical protein